MKSKKIKTTAVLCALGAIGAGAALVACGNTDDANKERYEPDYTFPDKSTHAVDSNIKLDGKLDDEVYKNQRWLEINKEHGGETANMRVTSYFGEQGIYLGFDVTESGRIYVNHDRASYYNSGVEMYLAMGGTQSIHSDSSFEVDLEADGTLTFKRSIKYGWSQFHGPADIMAKLVTTTKGGEVNTEKCYGYTHELFIPYDYLVFLGVLNEGERPEEIYVNPVLITSYSYEGTKLNVDRHWYNTVAEQIDGDGWATPSTNYHFNKDGLLSHDINVNQVGEGTVGEYRGYNYAVDKNSLTLKVEPKDGSRLKSFAVNGVERKYDLSDGLLTLSKVDSDVNIDVVFEKIPSQKGTVSGTVTYTGADSAFFDDAEILVSDGANTFKTAIDGSTGAYSVSVPYGDYSVSVVSLTGGYVVASADKTVDAATLTADFAIDDSMYGAKRTVFFKDLVISRGNKDLLSEKEAPVESDKFVYKTFLGISKDGGAISKTFRYVCENVIYCGGENLRLQLINWEGKYTVKILYKENGAEKNAAVSLDGAAVALMNKFNGLYLTFIRDGENVTVAYLNETGNWNNIINSLKIEMFADGAPVTRIALAGAEGVNGDYPAANYGGVIIQGETDPTKLPAVTVKTSYDKNAVTLSGLQPSYAIGSTVTFDAQPTEGYLLKVYLNGEELQKSGGGYTFAMLGEAELSFVTVKDEPQDLSVKIRGYKFGEYGDLDGVKATLKGIKDYTATIEKGVLKVENMIAGEYEVFIEGYGTKIIDFGKDEEITLAFSMFIENASWDLTEQNGKTPTVYATAGRASLSSVGQYGDFSIETTIKYNTRLAASVTGGDEFYQRKGYDLTFEDGKTLQPSLNYHSIQFAPLNSSAVAGTSWSVVYAMTADEIAKYHSDEGIKLGITRIGRGVTVTIDGKAVAQFLLPEGYDELSANIGYHQYLGRGLGKESYGFTFNEKVSRDIKISELSNIEGCTVEIDGTPKVGETVKLKVAPTATDAGAKLITLTVNGKEYSQTYAEGAVTVPACWSNEITVIAKYAKPAFNAVAESGDWNLSELDKGVISAFGYSTLNLGDGYTDFTFTMNMPCDKTASEARREIGLYFPATKKFISFGGVYNPAKGGWIQSMDGGDGGYSSLTPWGNMLANGRVFNERESKLYYGDGLEMAVVRQGAEVHLFIDGIFERTFNLTTLGLIDAATAQCTLKIRNFVGGFDNKQSKVTVASGANEYLAGKVTISDKIANGAVAADKASYNPLNKETVTLTLTPESGYMIKSLVVNGADVTESIAAGKYSFICKGGNNEVSAEFAAVTNVATDKIKMNATDERGDAVTIPAGRTFTFTNVPNGKVYTAVSKADGGLEFKDGQTTVTEIPTLTYSVTSTHCESAVATVTADGATIEISYRTVAITAEVVENTKDINLAALVGMNKVLAYERWISEWDTAIDTQDDYSLLSGSAYWTLNGTKTARPANTTYGAITSNGGYLVKGLKGQEEYESWAPVIMTESVSKVYVRKDVTKLRVYAGKWWGEQSDVTFTLSAGGKVYSSKTVRMGGNAAGHAIVEFTFDTADMAEQAKIEFELKISASGSEGYSVSGLQLLGKLR